MELPLKNISLIIKALNDVGITNKYLQAGILATCWKETGLKPIRENLNYTSPSRLMFVYPSKFQSSDDTIPYLNNPIKLANYVYGGKYGNNSDEGFKYRGAGFNGLTFKNNYIRYSNLSGIDLVSDPDVLNNVDVASKVLAYFYSDMLKKCNISKYTLDHSNDINNLDAGVRVAVAITSGCPSSTTGNIFREGLSKASIVAPELLSIVKTQKGSGTNKILPLIFVAGSIGLIYLFIKK